MALIDLLDIYKNYEAQKILEGVNFHVDEGERIAMARISLISAFGTGSGL